MSLAISMSWGYSYEKQGYLIQFERNVSYFTPDNKTIKKEIDITIFNEDKSEKYAIELKCPLNGQYPEQMYSFVKDIKFMEKLKSRGFTKTATVTLVSDRPFPIKAFKNILEKNILFMVVFLNQLV